jgi:hypothetical protein
MRDGSGGVGGGGGGCGAHGRGRVRLAAVVTVALCALGFLLHWLIYNTRTTAATVEERLAMAGAMGKASGSELNFISTELPKHGRHFRVERSGEFSYLHVRRLHNASWLFCKEAGGLSGHWPLVYTLQLAILPALMHIL